MKTNLLCKREGNKKMKTLKTIKEKMISKFMKGSSQVTKVKKTAGTIKNNLLKVSMYGTIAWCSFITYSSAQGDVASVTAPLTNLKTLVISIIGAIGYIILAKNIMEFAQAYQQQDSSSMNSALKGIVAGVMMAGISTVITVLGL